MSWGRNAVQAFCRLRLTAQRFSEHSKTVPHHWSQLFAAPLRMLPAEGSIDGTCVVAISGTFIVALDSSLPCQYNRM
jgi:hypothetical protein